MHLVHTQHNIAGNNITPTPIIPRGASFSDGTVVTHGMARPARGGGTCQTHQKACYECSAAHCCCCCCWWWWWCRWMASLLETVRVCTQAMCVNSETSPRSRVSPPPAVVLSETSRGWNHTLPPHPHPHWPPGSSCAPQHPHRF
jgi:hypothetical protein